MAKRNNSGAPIELTAGALAVDAACSGNPGNMEYRGVQAWDGKEIFKKGPYPDGTNNIGEFLALVHALAYFHQLGPKYAQTPIYSDSMTAMAWVRTTRPGCRSSSGRSNGLPPIRGRTRSASGTPTVGARFPPTSAARSKVAVLNKEQRPSVFRSAGVLFSVRSVFTPG